MKLLWLPPLLGLLGIFLALFVYTRLIRTAVEPGKAQKIAVAIQSGALVFLRQEYLYLLIFVTTVFMIVTVATGWLTAVAFLCRFYRNV